MRRTWFPAAALGAAALGAAAGALAFALLGAQPADAARAQKADLFYVQSANSARLVALGRGRYDLQLKGVGERAVWFADRPRRDTGQIATRALVGRWARGKSFRRMPPNAALEGTIRGSRRPVTLVLKLTSARRTKTGVRYRARLVGRPAGDLAHYRGRTTGAPKGAVRLRHVSLLIDSTSTTTVNGCVIVPFTACEGANLTGANLENADLLGADLEDADLTDADLTGADLEDANLENAYLADANLQGANLTGANLTAANLEGANLEGASVTRANFSGALFCQTTWTDGSIRNDTC